MSLKEKVKTTEEIAELWNTYCKEGYTEVPQKIMELMEAIWVRFEGAEKKLDGLKQKLSELLKQFEDYPIFHSSLQELEKLLKEKEAKP